MELKKLTTTLLTVPIILGTMATTMVSTYASTASKVSTTTTSKIQTPSVKINKTSLSLSVGQSSQLSASITPANNTYKAITWTSTNPNIASVDKNGKVLGKKLGKTTIYATAKSKTTSKLIYATCTITVTSTSTNNNTNAQIEDAYILVVKDLIKGKPKYVSLDVKNDIKNNKNFVRLMQDYSKTAGFTLLFDNYEGLKSKGYITKETKESSFYGNYNGGIIISLTVKSNANNKLVIDTGYFCGSLCAEGKTYTLEKVNGLYKIINSEMTWIS